VRIKKAAEELSDKALRTPTSTCAGTSRRFASSSAGGIAAQTVRARTTTVPMTRNEDRGVGRRSGLSPEAGLLASRADALGEHPELSFGIGGSESTISCRRQLELSDLSSSLCRPLVKRVHVIDVDMDHRGRKCAERPRAGEAFARLAEHDQSVVTKQKLVVSAACGAGLR
jgi:hypothetical protein